MAAHEKFHYRTLEEVKAKCSELGITLPFADDTSALAAPLKVRNITFSSRVGSAPMEGADSTPEGSPSEMTLRRYRKIAEGGAAIMWFEAISVVLVLRLPVLSRMKCWISLKMFLRDSI